MAASLWEVVTQRRGKPPAAVKRAASDLAALYEDVNHASLEQLAERIEGVSPDADPALVADTLVLLAIDTNVPHEMLADIAYSARIEIPVFMLGMETHGNETTLTWDGRSEVRNPARKASPSVNKHGPRILLLEDDPVLQTGTSRMLGRIFPQTPVIVSDNVDAAIANIVHHEISLIVSDVDVLGDKSGIDLFRWVEANRPELVDRYVFFTGNEAAATVHYRYLAKGGVTKDDLKAAIMAPRPALRQAQPSAAPAQPPATTAHRAAPLRVDVPAVVADVLPGIGDESGPSGKPKARFGAKVFIDAVWQHASRDPRLRGMTYEQFQRALVDANRRGAVKLARADLVGALDSAAVRASEIEDRGATFHFVVDDNHRDPWELA